MRETRTFTIGEKVLLFGKLEAAVVAVSSNGQNVQVQKASGGEPTWTRATNVGQLA